MMAVASRASRYAFFRIANFSIVRWLWDLKDLGKPPDPGVTAHFG
jgi:hypothetical protein